MTTVYTKSLTTDFGGSWDQSQFHQEIVAETGITPTLLRVDLNSDVIDITFNSALSSPTETDLLDTLITNHVPIPPNETPSLYVKPNEDVIRFDRGGNTYNIYGKYSKTVVISKEGQGDYTTIKDAVTNNNNPNTIFIVNPGTYVENNPITLPEKCLLTSNGTTAQINIVAANPSSDILIMGPWCKAERCTIVGATGTGARGVYFDGSVDGTGAYAMVSECIISNCDIGMETANGPDTLLAQSVQIASSATGNTLAKGVYTHSGGKFIAISSVAVYGVPSPPAPSAVPITDAYCCVGAGSKISLTNCGVHYCTHAVLLDDGGEVELNLLGATYNDVGICVGSTGTTSKLRASLLRIQNSITDDLNITATDADIGILSAEIDFEKVKNPNSIRFVNNSIGTENTSQYHVGNGDIRFGSKKEMTTVNIGQGKYDNDGVIIMSNDNLEAGTWTDVTSDALATSTSFNIFSGTAADNCLYIGRDDNVIGFKLEVTTATTSATAHGDVVWEWWDGSAWQEFKVMTTEFLPPHYKKDDVFVSYTGKQHIRFGLKSKTAFVDKVLNSQTKKWIRIRVVNALSSVPIAETVKLHTNQFKFNPDGFVEFYGDARPVNTIGWSMNITEPANSSPADQDLYLSDQLGVGRKENNFSSSVLDRIGFNVFLPREIDVSFPVKLKFAIIGSSGTSGDIELIARWNTSNAGSSVYSSTTSAPSSSTGEQNTSTIITVSAADTEYRGELSIDLSNVNPNPSTGESSMLWVALERDPGNANDTYGGSMSIIQITPYFISWREGGHIDSF